MSSTTEATLIDPVELVSSESRLFIDTNVFMDTDPRRDGGVKGLFERIARPIRQLDRPVIVPTKVVDELAVKSRSNTTQLSEDGLAASGKAANALVFLRSAEAAGLVRNDLGDGTNPYADDLFVSLFETYSAKYAMFLITNDVTLLLRINLLGQQSAHPVLAGSLTREGLLECDDPQSLHDRGVRKLRRLTTRLEAGLGKRPDHLEVASLQSVLTEYAEAFGIVTAGRPQPRERSAVGQLDVKDLARPEGHRAFIEDAAFKGADDILSVREIPGEGDQVLAASPDGTTTHTLLTKIGQGGEGCVYAVSDTQVIKILDSEHVTRHREEKIKLLVSRRFDEPGICFPQASVTNLHGEFVGYLMPRASGREFSKALFNPRRFRKEYPAWTKLELVDVAISFLEKVAYLHSQNIILGDINPKNLLVDANKDVWIIDADSWQLEGYPCPVGTEMFSAPSVIGRRYPDFVRTMEDERFAVATMLFMILITGQFPYARSGSDGDIVRLIKEGNFAFQYKENSKQDQPAGNWRFMWSHLQVGLKGLFWNTFHRDGDRYHNRPTDQEWLSAFRTYRRHLVSPANFDPMSNDVYPTRFKAMSPDTPLYECSGCAASMAGIWSDTTKSYATPPHCPKCRSNLPRCVDCRRHRSSLKDGRCYECNRKLNFSACAGCGQETSVRSLRDGRCYNCNQGSCTACGRTVPERYLVDGSCGQCQSVSCNDCGARVQKAALSYGRCAKCRASNDALRAERQRRRQTVDPSRLCGRCKRPFITYGNVEWHERNHRPVPTSHKRDDTACAPTSSRPSGGSKGAASKRPASTGSTQKSDGCFVATAVYGSYDCPEVRVLRRWRDMRLRTTGAGRLFIRCYYAVSPNLVAFLGDKRWFAVPVRRVLNPVVTLLMTSGINNDPYQDPDPTKSDGLPSAGKPTNGAPTWHS